VGIAKFRAVRAKTLSNEDGSDVALKPLRITAIVQLAATIATMRTNRRNIFQRFIDYFRITFMFFHC
jgi:hypothetical protein